MQNAGDLDDIKRNIQFNEYDGLKIGNQDLDDEKDEEVRLINAALNDDMFDDVNSFHSQKKF